MVTSTSSNVDLRDIRIVKKVGGTIEDTELVEGVVLNQSVIGSAGGPTRIEKAKIGLIQFQISAPKPDVSSITIIQSDYIVIFSRTFESLDGQPNCSQRLPSDGQDLERGTRILDQDLQKDQEDGLQRLTHPVRVYTVVNYA